MSPNTGTRVMRGCLSATVSPTRRCHTWRGTHLAEVGHLTCSRFLNSGVCHPKSRHRAARLATARFRECIRDRTWRSRRPRRRVGGRPLRLYADTAVHDRGARPDACRERPHRVVQLSRPPARRRRGPHRPVTCMRSRCSSGRAPWSRAIRESGSIDSAGGWSAPDGSDRSPGPIALGAAYTLQPPDLHETSPAS